MATRGLRKKRANIYYRQTARAFKELRQTKVFSHINRNLPYNIYRLTKSEFNQRIQKIHSKFQK